MVRCDFSLTCHPVRSVPYGMRSTHALLHTRLLFLTACGPHKVLSFSASKQCVSHVMCCVVLCYVPHAGVFWTAGQQRVNITNPDSTPGSPFFYRTDVRATPTVTRVDHPGSTLGFRGQVLRAVGVAAQSRMLALHRVGLLVMYDGVTGAALGNQTVSAVATTHEHRPHSASHGVAPWQACYMPVCLYAYSLYCNAQKAIQQ